MVAAGVAFALGGTTEKSDGRGRPANDDEDARIAAPTQEQVAKCPRALRAGRPEPTSGETSVTARNCRLDAARRTGRTVVIYLQKENYDRRRRFPGDPRTYVPVARTITEAEARAPLRAALLKLMAGATKRERRLGCFSIFSRDARILRAVKIVDGRAVVDFHRRPFRDQLAIVSASHAGAVFMTQLELTIFQFPNVRSIRYEFDGDCAAFGKFMQAQRCVVVRRSDRSRSTA